MGTALIAFIVINASTHVPLMIVCAIAFMLMLYAMRSSTHV
jgi:uncharacterized paraquat-inducible protein A